MGIFSRDETPNTEPSKALVASPGPSSVFLSHSSSAVQPAPYNTPRVLTAAAAQIKIKDQQEYEQFKSRRNAASSAWQAEAWEYYDAIGEIKYAFNLVGSVISRIRIYAAITEDPSEAPTPVSNSEMLDPRLAQAAERALDRLNSAYGGQAGLLRDAALNLSVSGECYLVQIPASVARGTSESWDIKSTDELITDARGNFSVIGRREQSVASGAGSSATNKGVSLGDRNFVGRIWRSHPRFCADDQTEILTKRGWLTYDQLTTSDTVLTLNHETGVSEWQPVQRVNVYHVEDEPMLSVESHYHSSLTTMDHRWPVIQTKRRRGMSNWREREWKRSHELNTNSAVITAAPGLSFPTEALWSDSFVELMAWFWTEGSYSGWRSHEENRINDRLVDQSGWNSWVSDTRKSLGISLRDLGEGVIARTGHEHNDPQQYGADISRKGLAKSEYRNALCAVFDVPVEEADRFYEQVPISRQIVISQSHLVNPDYVVRIREALTELYGPAADERMSSGASLTATAPAWREYQDANPDKGMTYFALNSSASSPFVELTTGNKIVSTEFIDQLTENQLRIFIETSLDADGSRVQSNSVRTPILTQSVEERLDSFERAAILLGIPYRRWTDAKLGKFGITLRHYPTYQLDKSKTSVQTYTGVVWCPTTENRTWYARRNGTAYFTGNSEEADSSLRGLLDLCSELLLLNRTFRATARSRLNAGALYLPDGLSVAAQGDGDFPLDYDSEIDPVSFTPEEAEDEFEEQLIDAMTTPIRDEESASAVVPLIIRGPAELGDAIKQFKFERSFDPALAQRADRVLERILQGLDVPKDVVTGLSNVKYSNALQIDESLYKAHIEPLMLLIVDSLTVVYLRPYLLANGFAEEDVAKLVVWYDPSAVSTRNDRAADANEGFDRMAVSYSAWRRAHGFSEADAPDGKELAIRMVSERGMLTPEFAEAVVAALAPDLMEGVRSAQQGASVAPVPPEVQQALGGGEASPASAPAEPPIEPAPTAPTPELFEPGQQQ